MNSRNIMIWGLVIVFFLVALQLFEFSAPGPQPEEFSYSELNEKIGSGQVRKAEVAKGQVTATGRVAGGGYKIIYADAEIRDAEGNLCSKASGVFKRASK